jgi:hypothetical protein
MRAVGLGFVATLAVGIHAVAGCSSDKGHNAFANATCSKPPCSAGAVVSGGPSGTSGNGSGGADAGPDGAATNLQCFTEPITLRQFCKASTDCPGVRLDAVNFNNCGFFVGSPNGLDVECVCFGMTLCPVAVQSTCGAIATAIASQTSDDVCMKSQDTCTPLASIVPTGAGGAGSCANSACAQSCSNDPTCLAGCGC